jgi:hypothetical protein
MKIVFYLLLGASSFTGAAHATMGYSPYGYQDPTRKDYYDQWGTPQGYSKLRPYTNQTDHYNQWGERKGYSKRAPWTGEVRHYDQWGNYQGSTR